MNDRMTNAALVAVLDAYRPLSQDETRDVARIRELIERGDPWSRALALHVTGSAIIVHPPTGRVLLRWHERMQAWLQVGGHADPGEDDPLQVALREAHEETGLDDLQPWPNSAEPGAAVQVAIVPVPAGRGEPEHEHADIRFTLATARPDAIQAESDTALLRWLPIEEALASVAEDNLRLGLTRVAALLAGPRQEYAPPPE